MNAVLDWLRRNSPWVGGFCMGLMAGVSILELHFTWRALVKRWAPRPPLAEVTSEHAGLD